MKTPPLVQSGWGLSKSGGTTQYHSNNHTKYKLDAAKFEDLWAKQNGCCELCGITFAHPTRKDRNAEGVKCYVDHKHAKIEPLGSIPFERVRGLLCFNCNNLLGDVRESLDFLKAATKYLELHGTSEHGYFTATHGQVKEKRFDEIEVQREDGSTEVIRRYYE